MVGRLSVSWAYRENVLDIEPQGPLPPEVYRRRRALALGIAALAVALIVGVAFALFGGRIQPEHR